MEAASPLAPTSSGMIDVIAASTHPSSPVESSEPPYGAEVASLIRWYSSPSSQDINWPDSLYQAASRAPWPATTPLLIHGAALHLLNWNSICTDLRWGTALKAAIPLRISPSFEVVVGGRHIWVSKHQQTDIYNCVMSELERMHPGLEAAHASRITEAARRLTSGEGDVADDQVCLPAIVRVPDRPRLATATGVTVHSLVQATLAGGDPHVRMIPRGQANRFPSLLFGGMEPPSTHLQYAPPMSCDSPLGGVLNMRLTDSQAWSEQRRAQLLHHMQCIDGSHVALTEQAADTALQRLHTACTTEICRLDALDDPARRELMQQWAAWSVDVTMQAATAFPLVFLYLRRHSERTTPSRGAAIRIKAFASHGTDEASMMGDHRTTANLLRRATNKRLAAVTSDYPDRWVPDSEDPVGMAAMLYSVADTTMSSSLPKEHALELGEITCASLPILLARHARWHKCTATSCLLARILANNCLNCDMPFIDPSPRSVRVETPASHCSPGDRLILTAEIERLLAQRVIEDVTSTAADVTVCAFISPISLANKYKFRLPSDIESLHPGQIQQAARDKGDEFWNEYELRAAARKDTGTPTHSASTLFFELVREYEKSCKPRLVFDGREVSKEVHPVPFTMRDTSDLLRRLPSNHYQFAIDLRSGFYQILLSQRTSSFMCFRWGDKILRYRRAAMGTSCSPASFCALTAELTEMLRERGVDIILTYVDDLVGHAPDLATADKALSVLTELFHELPIQLSDEKTKPPRLIQKILGLEVNSTSMEIRCPNDKLYDNFMRLRILQRASSTSTPGLSFLPRGFITTAVGKLAWQAQHTPGAALIMRPLHYAAHQAEISARPSFNVKTVVQLGASLAWWQSPSGVKASCGIIAREHLLAAHTAITPVLQGDAAREIAFGVVQGGEAIWGSFSPGFRASDASSTLAECYASLMGLLHFGGKNTTPVTVIESDSSSNVYAINSSTSGSPACLKLLRALHAAAAAVETDIVAAFVPRQSNTLSDALSKAESIEEAQVLINAVTDACRLPRIVVHHAPSVCVHTDGSYQVYHTCTAACSPICTHWTNLAPADRRHPCYK